MNDNKKRTIGMVQYSVAWEDKSANKQKISGLLSRQVLSTDILIFPEMTLTGYSLKAENLAEEIHGDTFEYFAKLSQQYKTDVVYGLVLREGNKYFNALVYLSSTGECLALYKKIHPFSYAKENKVYTGGEQPVAIERDGVKIGLSICYDIRFPELFRYYAKGRADIIINIANWPVERINHWNILTQSRAIENQAFVVAVNRCGSDPKVSYGGASRIIDPMGNVLCDGGDGEKVICAASDGQELSDTRSRYPFLDDMKLM